MTTFLHMTGASDWGRLEGSFQEGLEQKLLAGLRAVGQPLAALGLAATLEL